jgi:hypothetical protein
MNGASGGKTNKKMQNQKPQVPRSDRGESTGTGALGNLGAATGAGESCC